MRRGGLITLVEQKKEINKKATGNLARNFPFRPLQACHFDNPPLRNEPLEAPETASQALALRHGGLRAGELCTSPDLHKLAIPLAF